MAERVSVGRNLQGVVAGATISRHNFGAPRMPDARMNAKKPSSMFQFQLRDLFFAITILALALGWWYQHFRASELESQIAPLRQKVARLSIQKIMLSNWSDEKKLAELTPWVKPGDDVHEFEGRTGWIAMTGASDGATVIRLYDEADFFYLSTSQDGVIRRVGYWLQHPDDPSPDDVLRRIMNEDYRVKWLSPAGVRE